MSDGDDWWKFISGGIAPGVYLRRFSSEKLPLRSSRIFQFPVVLSVSVNTHVTPRQIGED